MPTQRQWSSKGFVAIDLDGTALVQKFDKNKWYGLTHPRSDLRQSLIQYMQMAQNAGYDIVIMTARPALIERLLLEPGRRHFGSKPTRDIVNELNKHQINISEVIRTAPKGLKEGLKGASMAELLTRYHQNGATEAEGFLFEDQLKQIRDVKRLGNSKLHAFDINSHKDRLLFKQKMNELQTTVLELAASKMNDSLSALQQQVDCIDDTVYRQEKRALYKILNDLNTRAQEAEQYEYQPELDWIIHAISGLQIIIAALQKPQVPITYSIIQQVSRQIFNEANPVAFTANTKCERTIRSLLIYLTHRPTLAAIHHECARYKEHLIKMKDKKDSFFTDESSRLNAQKKLDIMDSLIRTLENHNNPIHALEHFNEQFQTQSSFLKTSRSGSKFVRKICALLAKIPALGILFQTEGEQLVSLINKTHVAYPFEKTKHYAREKEPKDPDSDFSP